MKQPPSTLREVFLAHRPRLLLALLLLWITMLAGTALLGLSGGFLTAAAIAGAAGLGSGFNFFSPSAGIRGLTMARIVSRYFEKLVGHDVTLRIARDLRVWFFRRALPLAPAKLGGTRTAELLARLLGDIAEVDGLWVRALGPLFALAALSVVAVASAWLILPAAALLLTVLVLLLGVAVPVLGDARGDEEADRALHRTQLRNLAFEGIEGAADLAALGGLDHWRGGVDVAARQLRARDRRRRRRLVAANVLHGVLSGLGLVAMLWLALRAHEAGRIDAPMAAGLVFLTVALAELWAGLGLAWQSLQSARVAVTRLNAIVEQVPAVVSAEHPVAMPAQRGAVCWEGVSFAWPGQARPVLHGLDLELGVGQRIAITGDSGCGKTTLSSLLLRLYDPQAGRLSYGGADVRAFDQAHWHQQLAWLPQNAPVFAGTVAENLRLGDAQASDQALWAMLERVRLGDWARQVGGLQGWVGENGATLSAGQARRLALARALLRGAPILILDEPTEGLDVDTAHALLNDLPALLDGRSLLMITHDVLPEGVVDQVYRLHGGRLHLLQH